MFNILPNYLLYTQTGSSVDGSLFVHIAGDENIYNLKTFSGAVFTGYFSGYNITGHTITAMSGIYINTSTPTARFDVRTSDGSTGINIDQDLTAGRKWLRFSNTNSTSEAASFEYNVGTLASANEVRFNFLRDTLSINHPTNKNGWIFLSSSSAPRIEVTGESNGVSIRAISPLLNNNNEVIFGSLSNHPVIFRQGNSDRVRFEAGGNTDTVFIQGTRTSGAAFFVNGITGKDITGYNISALNTLTISGQSVITGGSFYSLDNPSGFVTTGTYYAPTFFSTGFSSLTIDWSSGNVFNYTITGNTTFSFTNNRDGQTIVLAVRNTGLNNFTNTWPSSVRWPYNTTPTQTSGAFTDVYTFIKMGTGIFANTVQNYVNF